MTDCTAWLPDELLDLILSGTDGSGSHGFLHPLERPLARLVCARWRRLIKNPSPQWARGHLMRAWERFRAFEWDDRYSCDSFVQGRVLCLPGIALFLRGPLWTPAALGLTSSSSDPPTADPILFLDDESGRAQEHTSTRKGPNSDLRDHKKGRRQRRRRRRQEHKATCPAVIETQTAPETTPLAPDKHTCYARIDAYCVAVGGQEKAWGTRSNFIVAFLKHLVGAKHASKCRGTCMIERVAAGLARLDDGVTVVRFLAASAGTPKNLPMAHMLVALFHHIVERGHDDVRSFLAMMQLACHASPYYGDLKRDVRKLWAILAKTASVRCISALVAILDDDSVKSEKLPAKTVDLLERSRVLEGDIIQNMRAQPMWHQLRLARDANAITYTSFFELNSWLPDAISSGALCKVLAAHGTRAMDLERALGILFQRRDVDYALADEVAELGRSRLGGLKFNECPNWIISSIVPADVAAWAHRHGYVPTNGQLQEMIEDAADPLDRFSDSTKLHDIVETLVQVWPKRITSCRAALRSGIVRALANGNWACARAVIESLSRAALPAIEADQATVWHKVSRCTPKRVKQHTYDSCSDGDDNDDDSGTDVHIPQDTVTRAVLLARLANRCDPKTNPATFRHWRAWCGAPVPIPANVNETAVASLVMRGLFTVCNGGDDDL